MWSILRNLHDKQVLDTRYDTIMGFMKESFIDKYRRKPIQTSGISDGQLQMLIQLTALFSEQDNSLILLDEPDLSLHPWALSVLAKAIETKHLPKWFSALQIKGARLATKELSMTLLSCYHIKPNAQSRNQSAHCFKTWLCPRVFEAMYQKLLYELCCSY